jgi:LTXXQ motif family protein
VKTTLFAAALVVAAVSIASISVIAAAPSGGDETTLAQAGAPPVGAGPDGGKGMRPWMRRPGMMGQGMGPGMMQSPSERCIDRLARRAGHRAYLEVRLNLTAAQRPLWDKLQAIAQNTEQQERQICQGLKPRDKSTIVDRMGAMQQMLSAKAAGLQAAAEPLAALYQALTPEQRTLLDHPHPHFHGGFHRG